MTGQVLHEEFNEFRMSPYYWHFLDTANGAHDTVANFKDGIKRDASLYPILDGALIDCGDIGGVAREDARVIFKDTLPRAILTDDVVATPVVDHTRRR
jgi:hypothetical protein